MFRLFAAAHKELPVNATGSLFSKSGIEILHKATLALEGAKGCVPALILGITVLIGVISSFSLSTTSLIKEIHTAHRVDQLSTKCVSNIHDPGDY